MGTSAPTKPRQVAYAQEGIVNDAGEHCVVWVAEDEAGYNKMTYSGTLEYCMAVAENINTKRGFTRREVLDVVVSSYAAFNPHHPRKQEPS